jgi:hypothetical protein
MGDLGQGPEDDLAIGEPGDRGGFVHVLYGSAVGLTAEGDQQWSRDTPGVPGEPTPGDGFGSSLSAGDFGAPWNRDDLAIGVPGSFHGSGAVLVLYGAPQGLSSTKRQEWTQDSFGVDDEAEPDDAFGASLTSGSFDGGYADLAIGVPGEDSSTSSQVGAVSVLYSDFTCGGRQQLCSDGDQFWTPSDVGMPGDVGQGTGFGSVLSFRDLGGGRLGDLVIGMPRMTIGNSFYAGAASVVYGEYGHGLTSDGSQVWSLDSPGVLGKPNGYEFFGSTLG